MSVAGLGVDIVEIDRMERALAKSPNIRDRAFTHDEQDYCDSRSRPHIHYAMRFAAKEAVLKAIGTGFSGMKFTDVSVALDQNGRPYPLLVGEAARVAEENGIIEVHLSLSFTHNTAVASALAITEENRPQPKEEAVDPMAELATSFKEMRAMLDTIEDDVTGNSSDGEIEDIEPDDGETDSLDQDDEESLGSSDDSKQDEIEGERDEDGREENAK